MNCGVTDIVAGLRIIYSIYEYGFNKQNSADQQYQDFFSEVDNLRGLLEELDVSLRNAHNRFIESGNNAAGMGAHDPLAFDFDNERKKIVGDFNDTLLACRAVLIRYSHLQNVSASVVQNLTWHLMQRAAEMEKLRHRIKLHCDKIQLVVHRLSINLLTRIDINTDNLMGYAEEQALANENQQQQLQQIRNLLTGHVNQPYGQHDQVTSFPTPNVAQKFEDALLIDPPTRLSAGLPLKETFDAMYSSFGKCIQMDAQDPVKHLLLLKCMWLIHRTKTGSHYREAEPAYYYRRAINRVERDLRTLAQSGQLNFFDESTLLQQAEESFNVWLPPIPIAPSALLDPHPLAPLPTEQFVIRLELAADEGFPTPYVTVYKHTEYNFRIIKDTWTALGEKVLISQQVYTLEDALIPRYALPTIVSPIYSLAIFARNELLDYHFRSLADLWRFQAALTGQEVAHDQIKMRCQFSRSMNSMICEGRVHLWQDPIVMKEQPNDVTPRSSSGASPTSMSGEAVSTSSSRRPSVAPSIAQINTISYTTEGYFGESIKLPALVIFSQLESGRYKGQFAVIYVQLIEGTHLDYNKCDCYKKYNECANLIISSGRKHKIPVRMIITKQNASGDPNPNTFDMFAFRIPRPPGFDQIKVEYTDSILLNFKLAGLCAKMEFDKALKERFAVREHQRCNATRTRNALIYLGDKPATRNARLDYEVSRQNSVVTSVSPPPISRVRSLQPHSEAREGDVADLEVQRMRQTAHPPEGTFDSAPVQVTMPTSSPMAPSPDRHRNTGTCSTISCLTAGLHSAQRPSQSPESPMSPPQSTPESILEGSDNSVTLE